MIVKSLSVGPATAEWGKEPCAHHEFRYDLGTSGRPPGVRLADELWLGALQVVLKHRGEIGRIADSATFRNFGHKQTWIE